MGNSRAGKAHLSGPAYFAAQLGPRHGPIYGQRPLSDFVRPVHTAMRFEPKSAGPGVVSRREGVGPDASAASRVVLKGRLNDLARFQPNVVRGVLEYWLAPCAAESPSYVDC
jgi:hypothetical protein